MTAVLKKELWSNFGNPAVWLVVAGFNIVGALFLFFFENEYNILDIGTASLQSFFSFVPWLLVFVMPALAMHTVAGEAQAGTLQRLFSLPISRWDIILGKYFSVILTGIFCILPSIVYLYTLYNLGITPGNIDWGATLGSYMGLIFLMASFAAVGILSSSIAATQPAAFLLGVFLCFVMYFGLEQLASYRLLGGADFFLQKVGFYSHYNGFTHGLLDIGDISYFMLIIFICLYVSVYFIKRKQ